MKNNILAQLAATLIAYVSIANANLSDMKIAISHYIPTAPETNPWTQAVILQQNKDTSWSTVNIPWVDRPFSSVIEDAVCTGQDCIATVYSLIRKDGHHYEQSLPFFLVSYDEGKNWYVNNNITGLPEIHGGYTKKISCHDDICISIGSYDNPGLYSKPMLLRSPDHGNSWSFTSLPFPSDMPYEGRGYLDALTFHGNIFLIVGSYSSSANDSTLVLFRSEDKGKSWLLSKNITGIPKSSVARISHMKCNTNACIAAGIYTMQVSEQSEAKEEYPLLLVSKDQGKSWSFIDTPFIPKIDSFIINDIVDSNGSFILAGKYGLSTRPYQYKGFILTTHDNGESWSFMNKIPKQENDLTALNTIHCSDNICLAGGDNSKGLNLLISSNNGLSWSSVQKITGMKEIPTIDVIHCSENDCIALGSFIDHYAYPVALLSHDKGITWSANKNIFNFPKNIYELNFSHIS